MMSVIHSGRLLDVEINGRWTNLRFFRHHLTAVAPFEDQPRMVRMNTGAISEPADATLRNKLIDFAVNQKTANAVGVTIPQSLLLQATEVIL